MEAHPAAQDREQTEAKAAKKSKSKPSTHLNLPPPVGFLTPPRQQQQQRIRDSILSQILEPAAADRLGRIRLVKASRAEDVENRLIALARSGQLRGAVSEQQLKEILGAVSEQQEGSAGGEGAKVVSRRRGGWDDDDLDDLLRED